MSLPDKFKSFLKFLKLSSIWGGTGFFITYQIVQTTRSINKIMNTEVLNREKKHKVEYVYIDDPGYNWQSVENERSNQSVGLMHVWKSLKHSLAWRLLWLCRHGNKDQRNLAIEQLAAFRNNKIWDSWKLAQGLDKNTAVLLARTRGADQRYFLPPPIHVRREALSSQLLSFKLIDLIKAVNNIHPHSCIEHFLQKYFVNVQEQVLDVDSVPIKPDSISERELCILCLDALYHHLSLFNEPKYEDDTSIVNLMNLGALLILAEAMLRYRNDPDFDLAVVKVLTVMSVHSNLLTDFFQNGLIGELSRLVRSKDVRLSSSAAVCLANLSGEYCYRPGLFLLHPIYRTTKPVACDTLLVHGLRGGVFVTWRQRDRKCAEPLGIIEATVSDDLVEPVICPDSCPNFDKASKFLDPELRQVMEELMEMEEEMLLSEYDVILHDIPVDSKRESPSLQVYSTDKKRVALIEEEEDKCNYTFCWPKDWLPNDCDNLRILGVNYWSTLSEWLERCPLQTADIATRSTELVPALIDAGVGHKNTPVVWLAHSMGGLIAKQVLVEASQSDQKDLKNIADNTKALLFFSTPHKGSAMAAMPRAAAAVLWPSNDVTQLHENSPVLLDLHKDFLKFADAYEWETISFCESMPTLVTAFKVPINFVEAKSADLGRGLFYQLPLDHLSICKPATRQSIIYTSVLDVIQRVSLKDDNEYGQFRLHKQRIFSLLWSHFRRKARELIENIDESQSSESLFWFKVLWATVTTGFTD